MASLNQVFLIGNLTRNPELRYTTGGAAVCKLGLAVNRRYTTSQGEDREEVCFVDIEVWGRQAESCNQYLTKGAPALVEGRLRYDSWEDRETGRKRSRLTVHAVRVQFLGAPARSSGAFGEDAQHGAPGGEPPPPAVPPRPQPRPAASPRPAEPAPPPEMPPFEPQPQQQDAAEDDIPF